MKFSWYLTIFPSHFNNIYLQSFRLLENVTKNNEILQKVMIFQETNKILWNFLVQNFTFVQLQCSLLTSAFAFCTLESWPQNFGLVQTDSKFWNFRLGNGKSLKIIIVVFTCFNGNSLKCLSTWLNILVATDENEQSLIPANFHHV